MKRIAVIGAGIGGIVLARELAPTHDVVVFEKGRGVGGRMATRYAGDLVFDHGAQYFTVRDRRFADLLEPVISAGAVAPWVGPIARIEGGSVVALADPRDVHYVGVPNMNSVVKALASGVLLRTGVEIASLKQRSTDGWTLWDNDGEAHGQFDWVISTTTAHQTLTLFATHAPSDGPMTTTRMSPCYAMMIGFPGRLDLPWIAARVKSAAIDWIGVNSTKPGRDKGLTTLVVHSTSDWAAEHLGQDLDHLGDLLAAALFEATGIKPDKATFRATHRWASARRQEQPDSLPYVDFDNGLAATGDWTTGSRVEQAVLSALRTAHMVLAGAF